MAAERYALLSVHDKTGVVELARGLVRAGLRILSTGGTLSALRSGGVEVEEVAERTGWPEMMGGRVKTLHPRVHGGILAVRDDAEHRRAMEEHGIPAVDVVVVNLYPFRETAARAGAARAEVVEMVDIGGPAMVRSAAKNHAHVAVVVDPADYGALLEELAAGGGLVPAATRLRLAVKAFQHTAAYDAAVAEWLCRQAGEEGAAGGAGAATGGGSFPEVFCLAARKAADLRYGENPHQTAAFYRHWDAPAGSLAAAEVLGGKELSYNNLLDLDAAWLLVAEFQEPACAVVKHTNPCGCAVGTETAAAFAAALAADPVSAYGGIVACNRPVDLATARAMGAEGTFLEAIVAPEFTGEALSALREARWGRSVRLLQTGALFRPPHPWWVVRAVTGGLLVQAGDAPEPAAAGAEGGSWKVATRRPPTAEEERDLRFAWRVAKHVKSNAIVLARSGATVGVGAGQMSRVEAVQLAVTKAGERARGAVLASDAFFPFADGIEAAAAAGVAAAIQPGGSRRDREAIEAADRAGLAMVFTATRHFLH